MSKLVVALDCDGIVFDANSYVRSVAGEVLGRPMPPPSEHQHFEFDKALGLTKSEWRAVEDTICDRGLIPTLFMNWLPGAIEFVKACQKCYDVFFLTSHWRGCESWVTYREQRLRDTFGDVDVVFAHNKTRATFDVLVDDRLENVEAVQAAKRGGAILFSQPWNASREVRGVPRARSYAEVLEILKECEHKP